ncbi:NlpC/P60 family protein [Lacimicrobium sp. SS2-24]|uniref:NlpC/P60 family protein n=1 Tax=Lacimicrobium sp. SS2-24 TaxID=2005569 RepID=UPI000B4B8965|nr:NlpC/P60 family protein [Lacimicrobium sp. SS2-24]
MKRLPLLINVFTLLALSCSPSLFATETDVPGVTASQLTPQYWVDKTHSADEMLLTPHAIEELNQRTFKLQSELTVLENLPGHYDKASLKAMIEEVSSVPRYDRFYADGRQLTQQDYDKYLQNMDLGALKTVNPVQFALVTTRTTMRRFPSDDKAYNDEMDLDIDRFIETGVFPGDALAILHRSRDGNWFLARAYHYLAWIPAKDVALGKRDEVLSFRQSDNFVVITGAKVFTNYNPQFPQLSEKQLDMGVRLPLMDNQHVGHELYGQNPYTSYVVKLPYRDEKGQLSIRPALISKNQDVHIGYLPFTRENIIRQGFKFLGERYGWGHDYNARDCTGFVSEVYRTFGILMPRNSTQQGKGEYGQNLRFNASSSTTEKHDAISNMEVGDLVYIPGHVVMYLGEDNGQPYVIHDVHGMSYLDSNNNYYTGTLNGVSVTPLLPMRLSESSSYVDKIYTIKSIR